jgi:hypothetical protein
MTVAITTDADIYTHTFAAFATLATFTAALATLCATNTVTAFSSLGRSATPLRGRGAALRGRGGLGLRRGGVGRGILLDDGVLGERCTSAEKEADSCNTNEKLFHFGFLGGLIVE